MPFWCNRLQRHRRSETQYCSLAVNTPDYTPLPLSTPSGRCGRSNVLSHSTPCNCAPQYDKASLVLVTWLGFIHAPASDDFGSGGNRGCRQVGVDIISFSACHFLVGAPFHCALAGRAMFSSIVFGIIFVFTLSEQVSVLVTA